MRASLAEARPPVTPTDHVENWGRCEGCQQLKPIHCVDRCRKCADEYLWAIVDADRAQEQTDAIAKIARRHEIPDDEYQAAIWTLRPDGVTINADPGRDDLASLPLAKTALRSDRLVAGAIARITSKRLWANWSLEYALRSAALGRDLIKRELAEMGHTLDRGTVANSLRRLCQTGTLTQVDQLGDWVDPYASGEQIVSKHGTLYENDPVAKTGAFLYTLNVIYRKLGDIAHAAMASLRTNVGAWVNCSPQRRIEAWCEGLKKNARHGNRNHGGYLLALRCTEAGLGEVDAEGWMRVYQEHVRDLGSPAYSWREARCTLASVYRKLSRSLNVETGSGE